MKKIFIISLVFLLAFTSTLAFAANEGEEYSIVADALVVRPLSLASIVVGASVFVVSLPFTVISGSFGKVTHVLIVNPVDFTFNRPIGDFNYKLEYSKD